MTLGIVVRADQGGLGNQLWEIWRHLRPERTLLINLPPEKGRGVPSPHRYDAEWTELHLWNDDVVPDHVIRDFATGCDKVLSVEVIYSRRGWEIVRECGATGVIYSNPELYEELGADVVRCPTDWAMSLMPDRARVLPQPVALDRFTYRRRTSARRFYHPSAPAMLDRNGTQSVLAALPLVRNECEVVVRGGEYYSRQVGNVRLTTVPNLTGPYWEQYSPDLDVLLLPRRYGGLCLPLLEAAACGMPAIMTGLPPQSGLPHVREIPVTQYQLAPMRGGTFPVYEPRPEDVAAAIDALIEEPAAVEILSDAARTWAVENSWDTLTPTWKGLLS